MTSLEMEKNDNIVENSKKRKSNTTMEKVKKKKKHSEVVEMKDETDTVIVKVKKHKKKKHVEEAENKEQSDEVIEEQSITTEECTENNSKSKPKKVRSLPTVTIAVPGSILDNAQSPEFRTYLAGQIARAACIYKIDEVCFVIYFYCNLFIMKLL